MVQLSSNSQRTAGIESGGTQSGTLHLVREAGAYATMLVRALKELQWRREQKERGQAQLEESEAQVSKVDIRQESDRLLVEGRSPAQLEGVEQQKLAPGPDEPFYMVVDAQFQHWWTVCKKQDPIPAGYVVPILRNLQGHPEGPRLWNKHADQLIRSLGYKQTTHEPCLYYKMNDNGRLVLILRQVDDFIIGAPTRTDADII